MYLWGSVSVSSKRMGLTLVVKTSARKRRIFRGGIYVVFSDMVVCIR